MQELRSSVNFEYLKSRAVAARKWKESLPEDVFCDIDTSRFTWGLNNVVFEIRFSDGIYWVARIQITPVTGDKDGENVIMASEIATMNFVRSRTTIPIPRVFDYETSSDALSGYPYVLLEYMPGRTCDNILAKTVPPEYTTKVAKQLANVFFELQNLAFDRIGRMMMKASNGEEFELIPPASDGNIGQPHTSLEYFHKERRAENAEILALHPNDADWATAAWILKLAISHMAMDDRVHGPFPLTHLDLHHGNLLFDEEFNLTAVLDWSHAQTAPLERLAVFPDFMTYPLLSEEENMPILEFRDLVIRFLKEKEKEMSRLEGQSRDGNRAQTSLSELIDSPRARIAHFCTYSNPRRALWDAKRACKIMFGDVITWEQLKEVYGTKPLCWEESRQQGHEHIADLFKP